MQAGPAIEPRGVNLEQPEGFNVAEDSARRQTPWRAVDVDAAGVHSGGRRFVSGFRSGSR
jgi:hypothetical protein